MLEFSPSLFGFLQVLMNLFDDALGVFTSGDGFGEVYPKVFKAVNHVHSYTINEERRWGSASLS